MDEEELFKEEKKLTNVATEQKLGLGVKILLLTVVVAAAFAGVFVALSIIE